MGRTTDQPWARPAGVATDDGRGRRLVVGDDGSTGADLAWRWVAAHPWPGWRISVVTARPPELPPVARAVGPPRPWDVPRPRRLDPGPADEPPPRVEHLLVEADPRLVLDGFADADLVVVGARGAGPLKRVGIGSTAEWLVGAHRPLMPVVVARTPDRTRRVLLGVDGSEHARRAVVALASLPWLDRCEVIVVGVDDGRGLVGPAVEAAAAELSRRGASGLDARVLPGRRPGFPGYARAMVLAVVDADRPDLVALGARGAGGVRGLLLGSVTRAVLRHTRCSVLVAKSGDGPD